MDVQPRILVLTAIEFRRRPHSGSQPFFAVP